MLMGSETLVLVESLLETYKLIEKGHFSEYIDFWLLSLVKISLLYFMNCQGKKGASGGNAYLFSALGI